MAMLDLLDEVEDLIDDDVVSKLIVTKSEKKIKEPKKSKYFDERNGRKIESSRNKSE